MKTKLFMAAILTLILESCTSSATHEDWQKMQDKECASRITKFNYEGHSYLLYRYVKEGIVFPTYEIALMYGIGFALNLLKDKIETT